MTLVLIVVSLLAACFISVDAMKNGVGKKRWFAMGLLMGPFAWPLLNVKKQMTLRKQSGINITYFRA